MNDTDWVMLKKYYYARDVHLDRLALESHGIDSTIQEDIMSSVNPVYSGATGGDRLFVRAEDLEEAAAILEIEYTEPIPDQGRMIWTKIAFFLFLLLALFLAIAELIAAV